MKIGLIQSKEAKTSWAFINLQQELVIYYQRTFDIYADVALTPLILYDSGQLRALEFPIGKPGQSSYQFFI